MFLLFLYLPSYLHISLLSLVFSHRFSVYSVSQRRRYGIEREQLKRSNVSLSFMRVLWSTFQTGDPVFRARKVGTDEQRMLLQVCCVKLYSVWWSGGLVVWWSLLLYPYRIRVTVTDIRPTSISIYWWSG